MDGLFLTKIVRSCSTKLNQETMWFNSVDVIGIRK